MLQVPAGTGEVPMRSSRTHVSLLAVSLLLAPAGCSSWRSIQKEDPAAYISRERPRSARLTLADSTLVLGRLLVSDGSVVGVAKRSGVDVTVPASDIRKLEVPGNSPKGARIVLGTVGILAIAMGAAMIIFDGSRGIY